MRPSPRPQTVAAALAALLSASVVVLAVLLLLIGGRTAPVSDPAEASAAAPRPTAVGGSVPEPTGAPSPGSSVSPRPERGPDLPEQANIVVVVMDDVSMDLVPTMVNLGRLARTGATYERSYVVNSLCCPSRAAMLTGQPPHLTGVLTNTSSGYLGPRGGWEAFRDNQGPAHSYNVALDEAGYQTAFVGKYLNEYEPTVADGVLQPPPAVPGWDDFEAVSGGGYNGWGFVRTTPAADGPGLQSYPVPAFSASDEVKDRSYVGTVIGDRAVSLARTYERSGKPYLLHVAPYAAHARIDDIWPDQPLFPAAMGDRPRPGQPGGNCGARSCAELDAADLPGYGDSADAAGPTYLRPDGSTSPAPDWRTDPITLSREEATAQYRDRARMVQSVDRMLGRLMEVVGPDTYVVVTSDNGYHLGQLGLNGGKGTPYAADTQVPLVVAGPGIEPGARGQVVSSIDLASTFEQIAGLAVAPWRAGRSLLPSLLDRTAPGSRYAFFEHRQGPVLPGEPDADLGSGSRLDAIPSYLAVRSERGLLVRVDLDRAWETTDFAWELYRSDRTSEDRNVYARAHDRAWVEDLRSRLLAWQDCQPDQCRRLTR